jgi:ACS family glucarate transporter-like MFS transporter
VRRYWIALLLFFMTLINYVDKIVFAVAAPDLKTMFNLSAGTLGVLLSVVTWGYTVALIPAGLVTDRVGARKFAGIGVGVWSLAAIATGFAPSVGMLGGSRLVLGIGESATFPVAGKVTKQWAPGKERGVFTGFWNAGTTVGSGVGAILAALLITNLGWRPAFWILGAIGFVWIAVWLVVVRPPELTKWLRPAERDFIVANRETDETAGDSDAEAKVKGSWWAPLRELLRHRAMWGLLLTEGCSVYTTYFLLTWLPSFLADTRGLKIIGAGILTGIPFLVAAVLVFAFTRLSDVIITRTGGGPGSRRWMVAVYLLLSLALVAAPAIHSLVFLEILLTWSIAMNFSTNSLILALANDLIRRPQLAGLGTGLVAFGGNVFGLLAPIVTGFIVGATGGYTGAFLVGAVFALIGCVVILTMANKPVKWAPMQDQGAVLAGKVDHV